MLVSCPTRNFTLENMFCGAVLMAVVKYVRVVNWFYERRGALLLKTSLAVRAVRTESMSEQWERYASGGGVSLYLLSTLKAFILQRDVMRWVSYATVSYMARQLQLTAACSLYCVSQNQFSRHSSWVSSILSCSITWSRHSWDVSAGTCSVDRCMSI